MWLCRAVEGWGGSDLRRVPLGGGRASQITPVQMTGMNLYDIRVKCAHPPLCYDFSATARFLTRPEVVAALGTKGHPWSACNMAVNMRFHRDWMQVGRALALLSLAARCLSHVFVRVLSPVLASPAWGAVACPNNHCVSARVAESIPSTSTASHAPTSVPSKV